MLIGRNSESAILKKRPWEPPKDFHTRRGKVEILQNSSRCAISQICATFSKRELHSVCYRKHPRFLSAGTRNSPQLTIARFQVINVCTINRFQLIAAAILCELDFHATSGRLLPDLRTAIFQGTVVDRSPIMGPARPHAGPGASRHTDWSAAMGRDYINIPFPCRIAVKCNLPVVGRPPWAARIRVPKCCQLKRLRAVRV
jgi:hypothetical protein